MLLPVLFVNIVNISSKLPHRFINWNYALTNVVAEA